MSGQGVPGDRTEPYSDSHKRGRHPASVSSDNLLSIQTVLRHKDIQGIRQLLQAVAFPVAQGLKGAAAEA